MGTLQVVSNDGRLLIEAGNKLKAILPYGPAKAVEKREPTLSDDIKRSKEKGTP